MSHAWMACVGGMVLAVVVATSAQDPGVTLIGTGFIPGDELDFSGLAGAPICQRDDPTVCIDQATLGGLGSGAAYTGFDDVFVTVPDRGPFDGRTDVPYLDRFHLVRLTVTPDEPFPNIKAKLLDTRFLSDEVGRPPSRVTPTPSTPLVQARRGASIRRR